MFYRDQLQCGHLSVRAVGHWQLEALGLDVVSFHAAMHYVINFDAAISACRKTGGQWQSALSRFH
eukprot:11083403-Karenia_brevis.AAC.1